MKATLSIGLSIVLLVVGVTALLWPRSVTLLDIPKEAQVYGSQGPAVVAVLSDGCGLCTTYKENVEAHLIKFANEGAIVYYVVNVDKNACSVDGCEIDTSSSVYKWAKAHGVTTLPNFFIQNEGKWQRVRGLKKPDWWIRKVGKLT